MHEEHASAVVHGANPPADAPPPVLLVLAGTDAPPPVLLVLAGTDAPPPVLLGLAGTARQA